ncbi:MAG: folate-binding protein [Gammaproteobacteria bacterium]|nr:MAG: folate-binding protein [Gammaproteobacteria bacterium]
MFSRTDLAVIEASGPDTERFLQGQLTCDVSALKTGEGTWGGCCTPKGRLVAVFQLIRLADDRFALVLPAETVSPCLAHLNKYRVFFKVTLSTETPLQVICAEASEPLPDTCTLLPPRVSGWQHALLPGNGTSSDDDLSRSLLVAELRAGLPVILPATSGEFIPQAVGLDTLGGVSFSKGCYTGQEVVARTHYKGKTKKHLALLTGPAPVAPGTPLTNTESTRRGTVLVSAADGDQFWIQAVLDGAADGENLLADNVAILRAG